MIAFVTPFLMAVADPDDADYAPLPTKLAPDAKSLMEQMRSRPAPKPTTTAEAVAAGRAGYRGIIPLAGEPVSLHQVHEETVVTPDGTTIPVRIYTPRPGSDLPVLVYFHGGGTAGDLDTHDTPLRSVARQGDCVVVAVQYRLAPEHPFPAAPDDCYAVTAWVAANAQRLNADPKRLAVGGDSWGGMIAAVVAQMARDRDTPCIAHQILIYPSTDLSFNSASWREFADSTAPIISLETEKENNAMYVPQGNIADPYVSPLMAKDFHGLPPATVLTGECDPLRDEGEAYAVALKNAGIAVLQTRYDGMPHGFFQLAGKMASGIQAVAQVATAMKNIRSIDL